MPVERVAAVVSAWAAKQIGTVGALSPDAETCSNLILEPSPGQRLDVVYLPDRSHWALRLSAPERTDDPAGTPTQRTWTTEVSLTPDGRHTHLALRVTCSDPVRSRLPANPARPALFDHLAGQFRLRDVRALLPRPWCARSVTDLDTLHNLLTSPQRTLPVIALTEPDAHSYWGRRLPWMLDAETLARDLFGWAHVVQIHRDVSFAWTQRVGKPWSVFGGAVRTYMPGLDTAQDAPHAHPIALPDTILRWRHAGLYAERAYAQFLVDKTRLLTTAHRLDWHQHPFVPVLRLLAAERARLASVSPEDTLAAYRTEVELLHARVLDAEREAEAYSDDALQSTHLLEAEREENRRLRNQNDALRAQLAQKKAETPLPSPRPRTFDAVAAWAQESFSGRLDLHPRAVRALKDAVYEDVGLVCDALELLATDYCDMRKGSAQARARYTQRLTELKLVQGGSISPTGAGEQGDEYYVVYPSGGGTRRLLAEHLRRGVSKAPQHCLAIYFFWDEETQQVVVGWLPSHLDNRLT